MLLLAEAACESKICDLNVALRREEDVVRLDVPVQNIVVVHLLEAQEHLEETVPAEILRVAHVELATNISHGALVHVFEHDVDAVVKVVQLLTTYQFIAIGVEIGDQTCLLDHLGNLVIEHVVDQLHCERFLVALAPHEEDLTVAALVNLLDPFPTIARIRRLYFDRLLD